MRPHSSAVAGLIVASFAAAPARANPVMDSGLIARQVPGSRHVQLTFFDVGVPDLEVSSYLRDGKAYQVAWTPVADYRAELGSGVVKFSAIQACDCNVEPGRHVLFAQRKVGGKSGERRHKGVVEVVAELPDVPPAEPNLEGMSEDHKKRFLAEWKKELERLPPDLQGTRCSKECSGVAQTPLAAVQPKSDVVDRSVVEPKGCIIRDGRYLRPPHKVEIAGLDVKINGVVMERFDLGEGERAVAAFNRYVEALKHDCIDVKCNSGSGSSRWYAKEAEVRALLEKTDAIVKGPGPRDEKLQRLRDDPALQGMMSVCAEQVLDRWDGYK